MRPAPLLAPEPYTIFLDESGDHSLAKVDPQYPLFGLAGVLMETKAHESFSWDLSLWKTGFFGEDVCLHMREITRNLGSFSILSEAKTRAEFWKELQAEVDAHDFQLICSVIFKDKHLATYGGLAHNPYFLTLEFILERFCFEMESRRSRAGFVAESRNPQLDNALQLQYKALLANGTSQVRAARLQERFDPTMQFQPKQPEAIGLQVADLAIGPACRYAAGMTRQQCLTVYPHVRKSPNGDVNGWGLKAFP